MKDGKRQMIKATWVRIVRAIRLLVASKHGGRAIMFGVMLIGLMFGINGLNVLNSYVGRDFMSSIENRNMESFQYNAILYGCVFVMSSVVLVLYRFSEERLGLLWRQELTWRLTEQYLDKRTYYRLDSSSGVANPDQRIAEDVKAFTTTTLSFVLLILNGTVTAISFSSVLWHISPILFAVAVGYAVIGTAVTVYLGKPLIRLNYNQLDMEANFRADLIHIRENSESIALAHREGRFRRRLEVRLESLAGNFKKLIGVNRNLGFFTNSYNYFIQIIPALLIAPLFIKGDAQFGVITQSTMAFATLLGAFSLIVTQFQSISAFTAVTARLHLLTEAIEKADQLGSGQIVIREDERCVKFEDVTLWSTDRSQLLLESFQLELPPGAHCVVLGTQDMQKVALFRAAAGVWDVGDGVITRPNLDEILFLPERPYLPPGSLKYALLRSGAEKSTPDHEVMEVIKELGLLEVVKRVGGLEMECDWDDVFSISEQHMLSIARIFLAKPLFAFLDRPGSSLPKSQIAMILSMLRERGIGVVVFAKNGESRLDYDLCVNLHVDGRWDVSMDETIKLGSSYDELKDLSC